jgi:uncharacterized protein YdaU (DUF1376 family)
MAAPPRLPFHIGDYLKKTPAINEAMWEHHGIYFLALITAWNHGARLPTDVTWLSERFGCSTAIIETKVRPIIKRYFYQRGRFYYQTRLSREHFYVMEQSRKQSQRRKSGWDKAKTAISGDTAVDRGSTPTPTPTPIPIQEERKKVFSSKPPHAGFDAFWDQCPRKVGKGAAKKSYAKAISTTSAETLQEAMKRYAASRVGEPSAYTVHPATWLNQERWLDEPTKANGAAGNPLHVMSPEIAAEEKKMREKMGIV